MIKRKRFSKKAIMDVGMLLLFIATIVSATIAASTLIAVTGVLQEKALKVSGDATSRLVSGLDIVSIYAMGSIDNQTLDQFEVTARLRSGSDPVPLSTMGVGMVVGSQSFSASYNDTIRGVNCTFNNLIPETNFCMQKLFGKDDTILEEGDLVVFRYQLNQTDSLTVDTPFELTLQPRVGDLIDLQLKSPELVASGKTRIQ